MEASMARRRIGQDQLSLGGPSPKGGTSLEVIASMIDWVELDALLAGISAAAKGEAGWPPLALFRALLLATWHDLSDVRLAEALDDRASFRRFCGFARQEPTPERTGFVRFRAELVQRKLDRVLFEAITRQLDRHGLVVRAGTLVDATLLPSASIRCDRGSTHASNRWAGHRRRKPVHGYKAHVATDHEASLIRAVEITTANIHDAAELAKILPETPGDTHGDSACQGSRPEAAIRARGGTPQVVRTGTWGAAPGAGRRRWRGWRRRMRLSDASAAASRRSSGPANEAMACGGCAGSAWPRRDCR